MYLGRSVIGKYSLPSIRFVFLLVAVFPCTFQFFSTLEGPITRILQLSRIRLFLYDISELSTVYGSWHPVFHDIYVDLYEMQCYVADSQYYIDMGLR